MRGKVHIQKTQDAIKSLDGILKEDLAPHDRMIAENIRLDLKDSLGDKLWYSQTNIPKH